MTDAKVGVSRRSFLKAGSAALLAASAGRMVPPGRGDAPRHEAAASPLACGGLDLSAFPGGPIRLSLHGGRHPVEFQTGNPLDLQLLDREGDTSWLSGGYNTVVRSGTSLHCIGEIRTPSGTVFHFMDVYAPATGADAVTLQRQATVLNPSSNDIGFLSRFSLRSVTPTPLREHDFFIPGIWYLDNRYVPPGAIAADLSDDDFIIREDRMPLPLVMMREKRTGATITLVHTEPDGSTCVADYANACVVDGQIQVASLGIFSQENPAVALYYPASEGERSYIRSPGDVSTAVHAKRWVERFHPVQADVKHSYKIEINISRHPDFPKAMRHAWRIAFAKTPHKPAKIDLAASYEAGIALIADWCKTTDEATGVPFKLRLPQGELMSPADVNYQMGFVGQQLPLGYHLLRYGLVRGNEEVRRKGEAIVDFWVANSPTPEGLPRTWYDTYPQPHWRRYNTFLRVASDGMTGALMAWGVMRDYGRPKADWLSFCRGFGDWLIRHQNADGSWYREYDWDGGPVDEGKQNTAHPIRFLIGLAETTNDRRYLEAALRAADWCYPNVHLAFAYVGGTVDNPNVLDKEAGFMALDAFLALHDATGEARWLAAARQAGDFAETWVYSWNIPIPQGDDAMTYPKGCTTTGLSIIATGHSAADLFMAGAAFLYYRLYIGTGDAHYADMARLLLYDTKQAVDINGSLGYGHTGLCTEALSLAPPRGHGVNTWLPWLTCSMIGPIVQLQETYGVADTPTLTAADLKQVRAQDRAYGRTQGLGTLG